MNPPPPLLPHLIQGARFPVPRRGPLPASTQGYDPSEERADVIGFRTFLPVRMSAL